VYTRIAASQLLLLAGMMILASPHSGFAWEVTKESQIVAASGKKAKVGTFHFMGKDCKPEGLPVIRLISSPREGIARSVEAKDYPTYPKKNERYVCNTKKAPGMQVLYTSRRGYIGDDAFSYEVIWPSGNYSRYDVTIKVM
jgi:hypothetical protein